MALLAVPFFIPSISAGHSPPLHATQIHNLSLQFLTFVFSDFLFELQISVPSLSHILALFLAWSGHECPALRKESSSHQFMVLKARTADVVSRVCGNSFVLRALSTLLMRSGEPQASSVVSLSLLLQLL
ncbi:hypothetical protein AVEN_269049-1 [Araneus ventricosus]|uniref:Uncharacterized protein n=1 Tax=Araneus ventricosus TaxID=182803 RepID=A0A4Y2TQ00_ARAVE|nr:hypothetical protein AVEN_269049-1 [Araneus ventricosus]